MYPPSAAYTALLNREMIKDNPYIRVATRKCCGPFRDEDGNAFDALNCFQTDKGKRLTGDYHPHDELNVDAVQSVAGGLVSDGRTDRLS